MPSHGHHPSSSSFFAGGRVESRETQKAERDRREERDRGERKGKIVNNFFYLKNKNILIRNKIQKL